MTPILSLREKRNGDDAAWETYEERDQSRYGWTVSADVKSISTTEDEIILRC